ncbi:hypothetical protein KKF34_11410 [Myxococcota bacterium]|nr:hypothetical protein [Myxococcota bacterium]MBU1381722.1 hypothetical protein [Myxococcota bacterium]MBU1497471.1 hypothetical protein [Myxococcota bacterium]
MTLSSIARGEGCTASEPLDKMRQTTSHVMAVRNHIRKQTYQETTTWLSPYPKS